MHQFQIKQKSNGEKVNVKNGHPKPSYISHKIFDNDLVAIRKTKDTLMLNKPGMHILELSKIFIYEFHSDYIKNKYGNNSRLMTDTDSLKAQQQI